jgi:hypothetical protein
VKSCPPASNAFPRIYTFAPVPRSMLGWRIGTRGRAAKAQSAVRALRAAGADAAIMSRKGLNLRARSSRVGGRERSAVTKLIRFGRRRSRRCWRSRRGRRGRRKRRCADVVRAGAAPVSSRAENQYIQLRLFPGNLTRRGIGIHAITRKRHDLPPEVPPKNVQAPQRRVNRGATQQFSVVYGVALIQLPAVRFPWGR